MVQQLKKIRKIQIDKTVKDPTELKKQLKEQRKYYEDDYEYLEAMRECIMEDFPLDTLKRIVGNKKEHKKVHLLLDSTKNLSLQNFDQEYMKVKHLKARYDTAEFLEKVDDLFVSLVVEVDTLLFGKNFYKEDKSICHYVD